MDDRYNDKRKEIDDFFDIAKIEAGSEKEHISPSNNYLLKITVYSTGENSWSYSRGVVVRLKDNTVVADIKRNYSHFWYLWCNHKNGNEYLLCGEDYQGQTVVNLTEGKVKNYFPVAGHDGSGFCWTEAYFSPCTSVLAVDGCYWACPYEMVFFDFNEPDKLPYKELLRVDGLESCKGWKNKDIFELTREVEVRKLDGIPYEKLSDKEQNELDNDSSLIKHVKEVIEVKISDLQNKKT